MRLHEHRRALYCRLAADRSTLFPIVFTGVTAPGTKEAAALDGRGLLPWSHDVSLTLGSVSRQGSRLRNSSHTERNSELEQE